MFLSTNSVDAARDVLIDGVKTLPQNKLLLEELIKFSMMHGGTKHMAVIDSIIADTISPRSDGSQGLSAEDAEDISNLYLEFVDYCGTIHDVRKVWNRHMKLFPDSARTAKRRRLLSLTDKREEVSVVMPNQASSSVLHVHLRKKDELTRTKKLNTRSNDTDTYNLQIMELDDKIEENGRELPLPISEEPRDDNPENNVSSANLLEVKEGSTVVKNIKNSCSESDVSSEELLRQTACGNQSSQAFQTPSKENADFSKEKCELEPEELKPQESTCPDSGPMVSQEDSDAIPESHKSNSKGVVGGHTTNQDNSASTQDSESAQIHIEINSPYSACHRDQRARKSLPPHQSSGNGGGNWHKMRNAGQFRRGPKFGYQGNTHRKQHQRQQPSPQQIHPPEGGAQMAVAPGYSSQSVLQVQQCNQGQNQFQSTATPTDFVATHCWPMQNMQIQNISSQSQTTANTTSHVLQHAMQSNGQYIYMQSGQEYNQLWQYYYYQQQQQQQQQLQLQQHYIQLQQESQQLQHSQLEPLQPQQLQQQVLQQQQPSTQSSSHPVADQGQAILTSQGHGSMLSQQSDKRGSVASPVTHYSPEKSTQEE